jgi:hypothetical protein
MRLHSRPAALSELGSLLPLAMIGLLIANDHVLKFAFHNQLTGKLSDIAICFVLPLLVSAALGMFARIDVRRRLWIGAIASAIVFSAVEMSDRAGGWFIRMVAMVFGAKHTVLTRDPTDLLALACVPLAVAYGRWCARKVRLDGRWRRVRGAVALATGSLALMATSAPERCGKWAGPTVFMVEGDCGSGGTIVVEASAYSGQLTITNQPALLTALPGDNNLTRQVFYDGSNCPYTLDQGEWSITIGNCSTPVDAAVDSGAAGCQTGYRRCEAGLETDGLWFTCHGADPSVTTCRSRLAVVQ